MSAYIKIATSEYYFFEGDIRLEHPDMGDVFVCPPEYTKVVETQPPTFDDMTEFLLAKPELIDGQWIQTWEIAPLPPEKVEELRIARSINLGTYRPKITASGGVPDVIQ